MREKIISELCFTSGYRWIDRERKRERETEKNERQVRDRKRDKRL
mgnify:CR=1 FL=1